MRGGGQPGHSDGDHHVHRGEAVHWPWVRSYSPLHSETRIASCLYSPVHYLAPAWHRVEVALTPDGTGQDRTGQEDRTGQTDLDIEAPSRSLKIFIIKPGLTIGALQVAAFPSVPAAI